MTLTTLLSLKGVRPTADWLAWNREKGLGFWKHSKSSGLSSWDEDGSMRPNSHFWENRYAWWGHPLSEGAPMALLLVPSCTSVGKTIASPSSLTASSFE